MQILLVDADSKEGFANLALMKMSAWLKEINNGNLKIDLIKGIPSTAPLEPYDKTYISTIFFQNRDKVLDYANQIENVEIGGSGWDLHTTLPDSIEHIMPDYSLYGYDYSMGFTSRGCIRNCGFCIVPEKEGMICDNAQIYEFHDPEHKKIMLLDNNFQASPNWYKNLEYIIHHKLKVNFNQGLDIRTLDANFTNMLRKTKYYSQSFKTRGLHFAFDDLRYEKQLRRGIDILLKMGIPPKHLMFYVLVGYNTSYTDDLKRIDILLEYDTKPYIMRYNQTKDKRLTALARYYNRMYYEFIERDQYNNGVLNK